MAGVSVATVSRALSNPAIVSETTRLAVVRAVEESGYTVNLAARSLRQQQVGAVLALVPKLANPFFSEILAGISDTLRGEGLSLLVLDTADLTGPDAVAALQPYLNRSRSDGVIVLDGRLDPAPFLHASCPPVIQACEWIEGLDTPRVLADNAGGARMAAEHLLDLGHRRLIHVTGPEENCLSRERRRGIEAAMAAAGLPPVPALPGDFSLGSGRRAAGTILDMAQRPTGVICDNDEMAIGLIHRLTAEGMVVPDDISVVGFDNIQMAAYTVPGLTTVAQRSRDIGSLAASRLLAQLREPGALPETVMPVELLVRQSTCPPAAPRAGE